MGVQSVDQQSAAVGAQEEFQTFGLPTMTSLREYNLLRFGSVERFIARLGLTPSEIALMRPEISLFGPSSRFIQKLICNEFIGSPFYRPQNYLDSRAHENWDLQRIEREINTHRYLRSVNPERSKHAGFPDCNAFPAIIREVPAGFLPYIPGESRSSIRLLLQIPQRDWEHLLRNCSPGPFVVDNTLAFIRLAHRPNNHIEVLEISSPHYDSLRSPELKERYKDWAHIMMRALIDYAAHSRVRHSTQLSECDEDRKVENPKAIKILFASPRQMRKCLPSIEDSGHIVGAVAVFDDQDPSEFTHRVPGLSAKAASYLYQRLPLRYGFTKGEVDLNLSEVDGELHKKSLIREVPFITKKEMQDPLFHVQHQSQRLRDLLQLGREFTNVDSVTIHWQPLPLGHRCRPKPAAHVANAVKSLKASVEFTETLRLPETVVVPSTPSRIARLAELRSRIPGFDLFREIVPDGFAPVSKGIEHGARTDWWTISECMEGEVSAQFIHLKEQNRHPSLRLFVRGADGSAELLGSYGFKGAGIASAEGVRVHQPYGRRLPIYHRLADIVDVNGKKISKEQYASHKLWGGMSQRGAILEFLHAGELALFYHGIDPRLVSAVAVPIAIERMRSIPTWSEDGTTEWHDTIQYIHQFMNGAAPASGLFQSVSYSRSDVRLNQLVSKVFGMNGMTTDSLTEAEAGIIDALRFLYYTHGKPFSVGNQELLASSSFGMGDVGRFLKELGQVNRAAAEAIYADFEFRTVAALGAVHGADGNLGGLSRRGAGLMFGGPQTIRNIDLYGTMHDYDTSLHLPWSLARDTSEEFITTEQSQKTFQQGADVLMLRESLYWLRKILFGFESSEPVTTERISVDSKQDFTVMNLEDEETRGLRKAFLDLREGAAPEQILGEGKALDMYREYGVRGKELAEHLIDNPW